MKTISILLLLLSVSVSTNATPEEQIEESPNFGEAEVQRSYSCGSDKVQGMPFKYCYRHAEATNNDDIVYFFHGLNGSETTWFTQCLGTGIIQKWWDFKGYKPRIVTISFGPKWLLVNNKRYPLLSALSKGIIPLLEKKMGGLRKGSRHVIGQSMGGFNAAEVALKNPGMFSRVALLCPAISTVSPYSSTQDINNYIFRTGAAKYLVEKMLGISHAIFTDESDWKNHDPLLLLKNYRSSQKSKFFVTIGMNDGYGFQEGALQFYRLAGSHGFLSRWVSTPGGHCNFNRKSTAYFIMGE